MKKIIDIIPPKEKKGFVNVNKNLTRKKPRGKLTFIIPIVLVLIIVLVCFFSFEGRGEVVIYPNTEAVNFEKTIYILAEEAGSDLENDIIAGEYFKETLDFEAEYEATGSDETATKASGEITVCNENPSGKSLKLVKNTRFLSSEEELIYRAISAFTIPGKIGDEAGCISVEVIAEEVGEDYNLTSGTFSIPGLSSTEYYTTTWGKIEKGQSISGGSTSEQKIVAEKDIVNSEELFKEKYLKVAKDSLKKNLDDVDAFVYFDDDFEQTFDSFIILASEGDKVDNFKVQAKITTKILVFRKADVDKYINLILALDEEGKDIVPESMSKDFSKPEEATENYALVLNVNASTYPRINETFVLNDIKGQTLEDAEDILKSKEGINSVEVSNNLFWKSSLPKNKDKIGLEIRFTE